MTAERTHVEALRQWRNMLLGELGHRDYRAVNEKIVRALAVKCSRNEATFEGSLADLARFAGTSHYEAKLTVDALLDTGELRRAFAGRAASLIATTTTMSGDEGDVVSVLHPDAITMYLNEGEDHA